MADPNDKAALATKRLEIDREILALVVKRARLSLAWAKEHPADPTLPSSELSSLRALTEAAPAEVVPKGSLTRLFRELHALCRGLEAPARVAYLGAPGAHGHVAARRQFGPMAALQRHETVADAVKAVTSGSADFAVLPYESPTQGPVHQTLLTLMRTDLRVVAVNEVSAPLCLLSSSGRLDGIAKVFLTPRDRAALGARLGEIAPRAEVLDVDSPDAACVAAASDPRASAVALEPTGEDHDLVTVERFSPDGTRARYCVATTRPGSRTGADTTCLLFSVSDEPGSLFEVLKVLTKHSVNMRRIHSWSGAGEGFELLFFVELEGHLTDRPIVSAVEEMKPSCKLLKALGTYPV